MEQQRPQLTIRPARSDDTAFVVSLADRFSESRPEWRSEREVTDGTARVLDRVMRAPQATDGVFIAEIDGSPAGFIYVYAEPDFFTGEPHAHVSELAVAQDGTGAGQGLMAAAEAWARERGHRYISLHVNRANERAERFYTSLGYDLEWKRLNKRL